MAKRRSSTGMLAGGDMPKYEKPKPSFSVDERDLPQIKDWAVGKKYDLEITVEMVSHSQGDEYGIGGSDNKKKHSARLRIVSMTPDTAAPGEEQE